MHFRYFSCKKSRKNRNTICYIRCFNSFVKLPQINKTTNSLIFILIAYSLTLKPDSCTYHLLSFLYINRCLFFSSTYKIYIKQLILLSYEF